MFSLQAANLKQQLMQGGFDAKPAEVLSAILGQCMQRLEHRGMAEFSGPFKAIGDNTFGSELRPNSTSSTFEHKTTFEQPATFNSTAAFNETARFNSTLLLLTGFEATSFVSGTIGTALGRDGTATLTISGGTVMVHGFFVPADFQIPSGARVGAIYEPLNTRWTAVVTDTCLEAA